MSGNSLEHAPVTTEAAVDPQPFDGVPTADAWKLYAELSAEHASVGHDFLKHLAERCLASVQLVSV